MALKVFFSWQADAPKSVCKGFIEEALQKVAEVINRELSIDTAARDKVEIDHDTRGVAGWAPITETIFEKIDQSAILIADLTFIGKRLNDKPTCNPNVLIECGWALKALGLGRILPLMNVQYGSPDGDSLPFNVRHLRHPVQYTLEENANREERYKVLSDLVDNIVRELRLMLSSDELKNLEPQPPQVEPFPAVEPKEGLARFRPRGNAIGITSGIIGGGRDVYLNRGPAVWLRLMPLHKVDVLYSSTQIEQHIKENMLIPICGDSYRGYSYVRSDDGFGVYVTASNDRSQTPALTFIFKTGELWSVNVEILPHARSIPLLHNEFASNLDILSRFLSNRLSVSKPYKWIAGMEGVKNKPLYPFNGITLGAIPLIPCGHCVSDLIVAEGELHEGQSTRDSIKPFFECLLDKCGVNPDNIRHLFPTAP